METKTTTISVDSLISLLKSLDDEVKEEIFEKVFIEEDTSPLSDEERRSLSMAESELKTGETIKWPFGK